MFNGTCAIMLGFFYVSIFLSKLIVFLGFCISCLICVKLFIYKRGPSKLVNLLHNPFVNSQQNIFFNQ